MKITRADILHAAFGWRTISFLRLETSDGIVGWSEYTDGPGSSNTGISAVVAALAEQIVGRDPLAIEAIAARLGSLISQAPVGLNQQAVAAIVNALLDVKGKALGVPVRELLGGTLRERVPLYWSHCVGYRARYPKELGVEPPRSYDDLSRIGEEVRARGFRALKTNLLLKEDDRFVAYRPGRGASGGFPELNPNPAAEGQILRQIEALRAGAGPEVEINLDLNMNFKPEGFLRLCRILEGAGLGWIEMDSREPGFLAHVRRCVTTPVASCENVYGQRGYRAFFEAGAVDVAIVDLVWNGYLEGLRVAACADSYDINIAPHNYFGHLADFISANFSAAIPNLRVMEMDVDGVPWRGEFYTHLPEIVDGQFVLPLRPGWGTDIDEAAVRRHPPTA
ncbi:mandelate racemase/muconate lactonizing enzyme family protein [Ancylobacter mangrovi]|uniref:mandelate racemase/muconate lactonizing enzyme family protein n=1 Tax=Ancylobacter mangrovi TaxID=2972472 RepID=UPI002161F946|nr:mandelate racemase/muconate lactonizing enzyme family protein [Ancylobacter mangrovi]MCS0505009.1 mandelate racemase/muconate lactonizing enzyme family protein [Ancylobacter mangrovi]